MTHDTTTPNPSDDRDNNLVAAGGIFACLMAAGLNPVVIDDDGVATNAMTVELPFMRSPYRVTVTVERVPDGDLAARR